jgi:DNA polymerase-1
MRHQFGRVQENKALNTLLQGAGALIMTNARIWLYDEIQKTPELDGVIKVLDYHDEETYECRPDQAELLKELMVQSVVQAGEFYKLNCPLDADAQVGYSWAEVH